MVGAQADWLQSIFERPKNSARQPPKREGHCRRHSFTQASDPLHTMQRQQLTIPTAISTSPDALNQAAHQHGLHMSESTEEVTLLCGGCGTVVTTFHAYSRGRGSRAKLDTKTNLQNQMASRRFQKHRTRCTGVSQNHSSDEAVRDQCLAQPLAQVRSALSSNASDSPAEQTPTDVLPVQLLDAMLTGLMRHRAQHFASHGVGEQVRGASFVFLANAGHDRKLNVIGAAEFADGEMRTASDPDSMNKPLRLGLNCRPGAHLLSQALSCSRSQPYCMPPLVEKELVDSMEWVDVGLLTIATLGLLGPELYGRERGLTGSMVQLLKCDTFYKMFALKLRWTRTFDAFYC